MYKIDINLSLDKIKTSDQETLFELMCNIYPPVYQHLWLDGGKSYLDNLYSPSNLKKELNDHKSRYFFVLYNNQHVGILKVLLDEYLGELKSGFSTKLQRIYLDPLVQGKGLGKGIIYWVEKQYCGSDHSVLWLEVMDTQQRAIKFYEKMGFKFVSSFAYESEVMKDHMKGMWRMAKRGSKT